MVAIHRICVCCILCTDRVLSELSAFMQTIYDEQCYHNYVVSTVWNSIKILTTHSAPNVLLKCFTVSLIFVQEYVNVAAGDTVANVDGGRQQENCFKWFNYSKREDFFFAFFLFGHCRDQNNELPNHRFFLSSSLLFWKINNRSKIISKRRRRKKGKWFNSFCFNTKFRSIFITIDRSIFHSGKKSYVFCNQFQNRINLSILKWTKKNRPCKRFTLDTIVWLIFK